jgi:hypothetical protein
MSEPIVPAFPSAPSILIVNNQPDALYGYRLSLSMNLNARVDTAVGA